MKANPVDLTLELRCADGVSTHFYQSDGRHIREALRTLASPRLMTQPQLAFASKSGVNVVPVRSIDMILAHTAAQTPMIFPLVFPAGILDICEVDGDGLDEEFAAETSGDNSQSLSPLVSRVEVHTLGSWRVALRILATTGNTVQDQRNWFSHFMKLLVVAFRLRAGGIGLINPSNITRVSACPTPEGLPHTALPMDLLRESPYPITKTANLSEALHS